MEEDLDTDKYFSSIDDCGRVWGGGSEPPTSRRHRFRNSPYYPIVVFASGGAFSGILSYALIQHFVH
jgi:hypothetical protein